MGPMRRESKGAREQTSAPSCSEHLLAALSPAPPREAEDGRESSLRTGIVSPVKTSSVHLACSRLRYR